MCRCIVTTSSYTVDEDFGTADAVFDCIGDAGDERFSLHDLTTPGDAYSPTSGMSSACLLLPGMWCCQWSGA